MSKSVLYLPLALGASYAGMMTLAIALNLTPVFLTTLSTDLGGPAGLTNEQLGRIGAVIFTGLVVGILLTGPLADRLGTKPFALLGNGLIAGGLTILGHARGYHWILVAAFVMGSGAGVLDMLISPIVCALQPNRKTAAMNWLHSFYCIGAVATILTGSLALKYEVGWRTISLWLVLMPASVALAFAVLPLPPLVAKGMQRTRMRQLLRKPFFLVTLATIFLAAAADLAMAQWLPAYAESALGYSKWTGGMALLWFSVAMATGRIAIATIGERLDHVRLMFFLCWLMVILFLVGSFTPISWLALGACVLVGLAGSCFWPSILAMAADEFPQGGASMFGILAATGNIGGVFMPWIVGATADLSSIRWGLSTAAVCPLILAVLLLWIARNRGIANQVLQRPEPMRPID